MILRPEGGVSAWREQVHGYAYKVKIYIALYDFQSLNSENDLAIMAAKKFNALFYDLIGIGG
ncbi:hypothetical protein C8256_25405 [Kluyvera genomosp. 2]|uniref:Uncharacterized protein n=1 Tax=Kluyvera genomosp. 2 TaxID=2774054 RepID=A0A2T2XUW5_9ENTR|nr:hypothetical protein C8256_25405 [Kluyvera genomosp. 2]